MENATEAFLIAGGLLISIIILALFTLVFNNVSLFYEAKFSQEDIKQIAEWNAELESYNKKIMYGTDMITLLNKVEQYKNADLDVEITVIDLDGNSVTKETINDCEDKVKNTLNEKKEFEKSTKEDKGEWETQEVLSQKKSTFKCTNIEYSKTTGFITSMKFEMVQEYIEKI